MIRRAQVSDLDQLVALEQTSFAGDRLSRRNLRYMLTEAHATLLVDDEAGRLRGYVLVLFNRVTALARVYSIAVSSDFRGRGVGRLLLDAAEAAALERERVMMRSEVRFDNHASLALFRNAGYRQFEEVEDYYEDHATALRFEKQLRRSHGASRILVPYYEQTLDFTCGSAALMMAMQALRPDLGLSRRLELRLWREATSIFMTSGHGGCGPYGLALAAARRGFGVEVFVKEQGGFLVDSVRSEEKKEVMRQVEADFLEDLGTAGVPVRRRRVSFAELRRKFDRGGVPILLISSYRLYGERVPHWVVITGFDEHLVFVHDPFVDREEGETPADSIEIPISRAELDRMARFGRTGQRAVVVVYPSPADVPRRHAGQT